MRKTASWVELLESWELVKTSQTADDSTRTIQMAPLLEVLPEATQIGSLVSDYNEVHAFANLKMRGRTTIVMPAAFVRDFFKPNFMKIASHCQSLIEANPVDFIFLVGGFAESELMQATVKSQFASAATKVIVPVRPGLAVLCGAVRFGKNQDVFASRVARFTYGIALANKYNASNPSFNFDRPLTPSVALSRLQVRREQSDSSEGGRHVHGQAANRRGQIRRQSFQALRQGGRQAALRPPSPGVQPAHDHRLPEERLRPILLVARRPRRLHHRGLRAQGGRGAHPVRVGAGERRLQYLTSFTPPFPQLFISPCISLYLLTSPCSASTSRSSSAPRRSRPPPLTSPPTRPSTRRSCIRETLVADDQIMRHVQS